MVLLWVLKWLFLLLTFFLVSSNLTLSLTDKHQLHLLISSCHPIPFRLALHVCRIYSTNVKFKLRINELETYLLGRGYNNTFLEAGFLRAANIPRANARYRLNLKILTKEDYAVFSWYHVAIFRSFSRVTCPFWMHRERRRWVFDLSNELVWRLEVSLFIFISFDWHWIDILSEFFKLLINN